MMGNFEAGLAETIEYVLKQFDSNTQLDLANNIFVTGGCANFPGNYSTYNTFKKMFEIKLFFFII